MVIAEVVDSDQINEMRLVYFSLLVCSATLACAGPVTYGYAIEYHRVRFIRSLDDTTPILPEPATKIDDANEVEMDEFNEVPLEFGDGESA